jgi:ferredoxin
LVTLGHVDNLNLDGGCFTLHQSEHVECPRFGIVLQAFRLPQTLLRAGVVPGLVLPMRDSQGWINTSTIVQLSKSGIHVVVRCSRSEMVHLNRQIMPEVVNCARASCRNCRGRVTAGWRIVNNDFSNSYHQEQKQWDKHSPCHTILVHVGQHEPTSFRP